MNDSPASNAVVLEDDNNASTALKIAYQDSIATTLDGSSGKFRNRDFQRALTGASNDREAMEHWLNTRAKNSAQTWRRYELEGLRIMLWSIVEMDKPVSSLDATDMLQFERFLASPVSRHPGVTWLPPEIEGDQQNNDTPVNGKVQAPKKRSRVLRHDGPSSTLLSATYTPFRAPLKPKSIEHTLTILKSMFSFWVEMGYVVINPLAIRKKTVLSNKRAVQERVLTTATWDFLYAFILSKPEVDGMPEWQAIFLIQRQLQRVMIFSALFSLGVRLSELESLRMNSFGLRESSRYKESFWVEVMGKGNKIRSFPVPIGLLEIMKDYRQALNMLPGYERRQVKPRTSQLLTWPSQADDSPIVYSLDGETRLAAAGIYKAVKATLADAVEFLQQERLAGRKHSNVRLDQLENATTHWMRHTAATQLGFSGVRLTHIKKVLGHASVATTEIYVHDEDEQLIRDMEILSPGKQHKNEHG